MVEGLFFIKIFVLTAQAHIFVPGFTADIILIQGLCAVTFGLKEDPSKD